MAAGDGSHLNTASNGGVVFRCCYPFSSFHPVFHNRTYSLITLITLLLTLGNPPHIRRDGALHRAGTIMLCSSPPFISPPHYLSYPPTGLPFLPTQLHPPYAYPSLPCPYMAFHRPLQPPLVTTLCTTFASHLSRANAFMLDWLLLLILLCHVLAVCLF
jgi:hypothetical protein